MRPNASIQQRAAEANSGVIAVMTIAQLNNFEQI
jgi:hypothetical protein